MQPSGFMSTDWCRVSLDSLWSWLGPAGPAVDSCDGGMSSLRATETGLAGNERVVVGELEKEWKQVERDYLTTITKKYPFNKRTPQKGQDAKSPAQSASTVLFKDFTTEQQQTLEEIHLRTRHPGTCQ